MFALRVDNEHGSQHTYEAFKRKLIDQNSWQRLTGAKKNHMRLIESV